MANGAPSRATGATSQQLGETKRMLRAVAVALVAVSLLTAYAIYRLNIPAAAAGHLPLCPTPPSSKPPSGPWWFSRLGSGPPGGSATALVSRSTWTYNAAWTQID